MSRPRGAASRGGAAAPRRAAGSPPRGPRRPHAHARAATRAIGCAVVTVSDTRGRADDSSGDAIAAALVRAGNAVASRAWVRDEVRAIRAAVRRALASPGTDAVIVTGGTGIAARDVTPEALAPLVERELPGFGECFRALSWDEIGAATWLSRAGAGVARGRLLFWLPGSTRAVRLALERLILPELAHAVRLLGRLPS